MKPKNFLTAVLLLFVAASFLVLIVKSLRQTPDGALAGGRATGAAPSQQATDPSPPISDGVIAYYFHGKIRCPTCKSIEAYAHEAVQSGFSRQLEEGRIVWRVVNYEQPENEPLATKYELIAPSVVLVKRSGGSETEWKNLARVWELVGDKQAFVEYVQEETRALLADSPENSPVAGVRGEPERL